MDVAVLQVYGRSRVSAENPVNRLLACISLTQQDCCKEAVVRFNRIKTTRTFSKREEELGVLRVCLRPVSVLLLIRRTHILAAMDDGVSTCRHV